MVLVTTIFENTFVVLWHLKLRYKTQDLSRNVSANQSFVRLFSKRPKPSFAFLQKNPKPSINLRRRRNLLAQSALELKIDECVFYQGSVMYVLYTDDSIIAGPNEKKLDEVIDDFKKAKLNITVEGDLQDFLGINIDRKGNEITLS